MTLIEHLKTKSTHVCRCWALVRQDGTTLGFTDHDRALSFDGINFQPQSGMTAHALASSTGLSLNNTEAIGALTSDAITEADIAAGRYDGAAVTLWQARWDDVSARKVQFRGTLGEITRANGAFTAELLGLTEALNKPLGRSYLKTCSSVLGDARCGVDTSNPAFRLDHTVAAGSDGDHLILSQASGFADGWFSGGLLTVQSGEAAGLKASIRTDVLDGEDRTITLWAPLPVPLASGDAVRLIAGCDKRAATCREKFNNFKNFQGFPDIPGDDWIVSVPRSNQPNTGGSLTR
ncbi:MAG: DUF2163 domain-containing protein [Pseudomonadota bacterium]